MSRIFIEEAFNGYIVENMKDMTKHIAHNWDGVIDIIRAIGETPCSLKEPTCLSIEQEKELAKAMKGGL